MRSIQLAAAIFVFACIPAYGQRAAATSTYPETITAPDQPAKTNDPSIDFVNDRRVPAKDPIPPQTGYVRPGRKDRFDNYIKSMFGPVALGKTALSAGWGTWRNSPEEWGDNWEGFGRRAASSMGKGIIKNTVRYGLDEALKYDSSFYRSEKKDVGSRVLNALLSPVIARDKNGKRVVGIPRIVGTYTGSIIAAETWYPDRYNYKDGLKSGTYSLGMNAVFDLIKEFVWKK